MPGEDLPSLKFVRRGSGAPLLLVHGISHMRTWDPVLPELSRQRDVIAVELPGFGTSLPLPGPVTVASLSDAVEHFIAQHDLGDVDVVGSSMGARIALELARRGHAGDIVALNPGGFWTDPQVKVFGATVGPSIALVRRIQPLLPFLTRSKLGRSALLLQFSARPWRLDPDLVLAELRSFKTAASLGAALDALVHGPTQPGAPRGSVKGTVAIGWGRNDRVTPPSQAQRAAELYPDASVHWFDDCGHFPHWDQPEQTIRLILETTAKSSRA